MTKLEKPVSRETAKTIKGRPIILTMAGLGSQNDALLGFRIKGKQHQVIARVSDLYVIASLWQANRERSARKSARQNGIKWKYARKNFIAENSIR